MPVFEAVVSKQKAMILSLTPASSPLLKTICSHVSASQIRACRDPKKELCVIFPPVRRTAMRSLRIAREGREEFSAPMQDQTLGVSPGSAFPRSSRRLALPRNSCSMDRALRDRPYSPKVHSKKI
ncbi:hypothetical protein GWK47_008514 [Chionoecetes opilio]|uniref:Uncharacterized protein n=1 Tax=Chionoecetes opilio TaxID=41210 RepID=A0A8J5CQ43_CHIOP|nr:hypothetical protein GWK47_008514 [Chionoecetes opilio]